MFLDSLYAAALTAASPVIAYRAVRHGRYRRGVAAKLRGHVPRREPGGRWIHAVSVGEVNLLPELVGRLEAADPDTANWISTSTDTGYDLAVERFGADRVFFAPLDFSHAVRTAMERVAPSQLVMTELELWPNWIAEAARRHVPVTVINARLSARSGSRYARFGRLTRPTFGRLDRVLCQDDASADRFVRCGVNASHVSVTGSIKFDNAPHDRDHPAVAELRRWCGVQPEHRVWVVGSTTAGEEAMAAGIAAGLRDRFPDSRLIIVPRHRERFDEVAGVLAAAGYRVHRRSGGRPLDDWTSDTAVLVDTIGELRSWWGLAELATVGGSFGSRGGQNMIEPAGYGASVSFGPDTRNFRVIADGLIEAGGATRVADRAELEAWLTERLKDPDVGRCEGTAASGFVAAHRGALDRTVAALVGSERRAAP